MAKELTPMRVRESVERFSFVMEERLRANDHKGQWGWEDEDPLWLLDRLKQETQELEEAMDLGDRAAVEHEAADVANFAMMIAARCG
jgi:NTP pyrophosphatase (non-canonical NTP hydrolase)